MEEDLKNPSPKRLKQTTTSGDDTSSPPLPSQWQSCGICLLDGEVVGPMRGQIDSCDHYFCFVCIMEWARVETRCPLCKRRFGSVRRAPKPGVFESERVVEVPVRDQIYTISGNATVGPPDPFANVRCSVCHSVGDENLLLLCDLCDSASHTHCVGLGVTVPEGDWLCHDCTVSKAEHEKFEADAECEASKEYLSIHDIVGESRPRRDSPADRIEKRISETCSSIVASPPHFGARTLRRSRNVLVGVQALRENWNALRSGSLSFTSPSINLGMNRGQRHSVAITQGRSSQSHSASKSSSRLADEIGSSCNRTPTSSSSYDVEKAWKMMNKAKSIEKALVKTTPRDLSSKKNNLFEEARPRPCDPERHHSVSSCLNENTRHKHHTHAKQDQDVESTRNVPYLGESSYSSRGERTKPQVVLNKELGVDSRKTTLRFNESCPSFRSRSDHGSLLCREIHAPVRDKSCHGNVNLSRKQLPALSSDIVSEGQEHGLLSSSSSSCTAISNIPSINLDPPSSSQRDIPNGKAPTGKSSAGREARRDDPKSNIQVLVKLSLKLLDGDKKLEVKMFKDIARLATHSILAACGLEQPKPGVRSYPSSLCWHTNQVQQERRRMSKLMPNCCRECFHIFVKDVVNSIMVERIGSARS